MKHIFHEKLTAFLTKHFSTILTFTRAGLLCMIAQSLLMCQVTASSSLDDRTSSYKSVSSGVSQGSILGPPLLDLYAAAEGCQSCSLLGLGAIILKSRLNTKNLCKTLCQPNNECMVHSWNELFLGHDKQ